MTILAKLFVAPDALYGLSSIVKIFLISLSSLAVLLKTFLRIFTKWLVSNIMLFRIFLLNSEVLSRKDI